LQKKTINSIYFIIIIWFGIDSPGFNINFESAPFKFTREYLELMGGPQSEMMVMFEDLFVRGFLALQKHADALAAMVQLFYGEKRRNAAEALRSR
jgi:phosphatidylinositol kinase/protein kinase (PI-3  family)